MTLLQLVRETFIAIGEPSDLQYFATDRNVPDQDPVADTDYYRAWCQFVDALNDGMLDIATWKFNDGRSIRFRFLEDYTSFDSAVDAVTLAAPVGNIIEWTGTAVTTTDFYKGRVIYQAATGVYALITRSYTSGGLNYFVVAAVGALAAGAATVSKREYAFVDTDFTVAPVTMNGIPWDYRNGRPLEIIEVSDAVTSARLELEGKFEPLLSQTPAAGTPTSFYKTALGLRFDTWPTAANGYLVRFFRGPRQIQYDDDPDTTEPELPAQWHRGIQLWMNWWGLRREELSSDAYSTKKDLEDFLRRRRTEDDFGDSVLEGQVKIFPEGK